jgi:predicted amidohydrolase
MTTPERAIAAVVQMTSTADVERNLKAAEALVEEAARRGASFVGLPENFAFLRSEGQPVPEPQAIDGPWVQRMAALAKRLRVTLLLGSLPEHVPGDTRVRNTSVLLGPDGRTLACYRKIHLFRHRPAGHGAPQGVEGGRAGRRDRRRRHAARPDRALDLLRHALPRALRELVRRGARVLCVPSAFTERTGKAHWEVLLRARAIENLAYVFAPAQVGHHGGGRASHGQALIADPWGAVVAQVPDGEGLALAELDFARLARLRRELPALSHVRLPLA